MCDCHFRILSWKRATKSWQMRSLLVHFFFFFSELTRYSRNEISPGAISHMKETPLCEKRGSELLMIQRAFNDRSRRCTLCGLVEKERKGTGNTCIVQGSRN